MYLTFCILAATSMLLKSIHANDVAYVPCVSHSRNLTLEDMIHVSDVVLTGRVITNTAQLGDFGTNKAVISYYYAYKSDLLLRRRGLSQVQVENFPFLPSSGQSGLFFLIREPSLQLALYCMSDIRELLQVHSENRQFRDLGLLLDYVRDVSSSDMSREFINPYPNPCDSDSTNYCSPIGAQCAVRNTVNKKQIRCTCNTGFGGNGRTCTPRTEEAASAYCQSCSYGARCIQRSTETSTLSNSIPSAKQIECNCEHFNGCKEIKLATICGSDGVTYRSFCHMKLEGCRQQKAIHKLHDGHCEESGFKPCAGMGSPLFTSAGLVQCNPSVQCPPQHFCHPVKSVQVCCPVMIDGQQPSTPSTTTDFDVTDPTPSEAPTSSGDGSTYTDEEMASGSGSTSYSGDDQFSDDEDSYGR